MSIRLTLTFPVHDGKDITFICDSGDYDPGPELDEAVHEIEKRLAPGRPFYWAGRLGREDC